MIQFFTPEMGHTAVLDALRAHTAEAGDCFVALAAGDPDELVLPLLSDLRDGDPTLMGACFPGLLFDGQLHERGLLLLNVKARSAPILFKGAPGEIENLLQQEMATVRSGEVVTCLVLADGLWAEVGHFLQRLHVKAGARLRTLGGGAGFADLGHRPCLFTREGLVQDAALLLPIQSACSLGVRHGWDFLLGPLVATRTHGNVILELNWRPAFDVYKEELDAHLTSPLSRQDFGRVAMNYPFAMQRNHSEDVVRDPFAVGADGSLHCVGLVPENSVLNILCGSADSLVAAAQTAADEAYRNNGGANPLCMHFHCVSRRFYLGGEFNRELEQVRHVAAIHGGTQQVGALTVGEIVTSELGHIEFLNKSVVIGCLNHE